jgi:hypothetical protein
MDFETDIKGLKSDIIKLQNINYVICVGYFHFNSSQIMNEIAIVGKDYNLFKIIGTTLNADGNLIQEKPTIQRNSLNSSLKLSLDELSQKENVTFGCFDKQLCRLLKSHKYNCNCLDLKYYREDMYNNEYNEDFEYWRNINRYSYGIFSRCQHIWEIVLPREINFNRQIIEMKLTKRT